MRHLQLLYTLLVALLQTTLVSLGMTCDQGTAAVALQWDEVVAERVVTVSDEAPRQGTVNDATRRPDRPAATIDSGQGRYRLCNTRPQRVLPTQGSKSERTPGRLPPGYRDGYQPFKAFHDRRGRTETAPFQSAASRLFYVIALRHLLC